MSVSVWSRAGGGGAGWTFQSSNVVASKEIHTDNGETRSERGRVHGSLWSVWLMVAYPILHPILYHGSWEDLATGNNGCKPFVDMLGGLNYAP